MKHIKLLLPTSVALILLTVGSAHAPPSISLQSFTDYNLTANTTNIQDCNSTNATLAAFACGNPSPVVISINGDGLCSSSNDTRCFFSPALSSITTGTSVTWRDLGNLYHSIVFNATDNPASLPPPANYVPANSYSSSQQFFIAGTYHYYDSYHPWMKGVLMVAPGAAPPPIVTSFVADGSLGWNVAGYSQNNVVLGVTHKINVYNQSANPLNLVYNDSGILEQYIDLSTRAENPSIVNLLSSLPFGLGYSGFYGGPGFGGYGYTPYYGGPPYSFQPARTLWWIDGPLDNGSVVELLSGYASVTGTKTVQLGYPLNIQDTGWTVTLVYAENSSQTQPGPSNNFYYYPCGYVYFGGPQPQQQCFVSESSLSVQLTAVYGQRSDLLLGFSAIISTLTQTTTRYPAGSTVYASNNGYGFGNGIPVSAPVSIQRTTSSKLTMTLGLSNTNLDLAKRITVQTPPGSTSSSTANTGGSGVNSPSQTSNQPLSSSLIFFLEGTGTATAIFGVVWAFLRARRRPTVVAPPFVPAPT